MLSSFGHSIKEPLFLDFLLHVGDRVECFSFWGTVRLSDGDREQNEERQAGEGRKGESAFH